MPTAMEMLKASNADKAPAPAIFTDTVPPDKLLVLELVKLVDADKMYQPVKGTSEGSRYYAVALSDGLKVAVRLKSKAISIRIEGAKLKEYEKRLKIIGFTNITNYTSLHLEIDNMVTAAKALGSVLVALKAGFVTPFPDVDLLLGK